MSGQVIATDEGTHGGPDTFRVTRLANGALELVCRNGESVTHREIVQPEGLGTKLSGLTRGRVRWLREAS